MSVNNISRDEARERTRLLRVQETSVELDLTGTGPTFRSRSAVRFGCTEPGAESFLNLTAPAVREVTLNGTALDPATVFDGHRIRLAGLAADNEVVVVADCQYMRTGEGLHRFVDPVDDATYLYTQFETFDAHRMYACFDQPDLKTVFRLQVSAPADWQVVSNMPVAGAEPAGAVVRTRFSPSPRMSTYVTALVAGPYHHVHRRHGGIELGLYCRASLAEHLDADHLFAVTTAGFDFLQRAFDLPYPFGPKYDQLFVPEFNAGAMENPGCVTFLEDYVFRSKVTKAAYERRAETVLHEMAHMWFGDLVTMRWWDDLWLNESFASYVSVLALVNATEYRSAWTTFANVEKTWAYRQDQLPSTHPIAADIPDNEAVKLNFDGITYAKGASVLKQLVAWVGQEEFLRGVRLYFRRHAWGNTTLQDLLDALEETSGRELSGWSKQWLQTAGVNTLRAEFEVDGQGRYRSFAIRQEAPEEHPTLRSHRLAVGLYDRDDAGALVRRDRVELDVVGPHTEVPALVGLPAAALVLVNDDDLTYAKIRLDDRSLASVRDGIADLTDSLARALCWAACWDMTRDAEMAARDYLRLVLGGVGRETDVGVVQSLLRQAASALHLYADPGFREDGLQALSDAAHAGLTAAEPGSDHQLAWARAFAATARTPEHRGLLAGLLDGSREVPGLVMDTELRWAVLTRLAATGAVDEAEIASELARDDTAAGRRHAAAARAARPTAAAKQEAWDAVVTGEELPNATQAAVIAGFVQPEQADLLAGYVEPYFAAVGELWQRRTIESAHTVAAGLFPTLQVSPETVARIDRYLAEADPPPPLRRLLSEGRDGLLRSLRARARDRAAAAAG